MDIESVIALCVIITSILFVSWKNTVFQNSALFLEASALKSSVREEPKQTVVEEEIQKNNPPEKKLETTTPLEFIWFRPDSNSAYRRRDSASWARRFASDAQHMNMRLYDQNDSKKQEAKDD